MRSGPAGLGPREYSHAVKNDPNLLRGQKPADRRVRVTRPESKYFRYAAPGVVVARPTASEPRTRIGRVGLAARRRLFGHPLQSEEEITQRLPKWKALPVFSSDVMSSVAYATEASLFTLLGVGTLAFGWLLHTGWDLLHHLYGNAIVPFDTSSSAGCAVCDSILAIWFFLGAPNVFNLIKGNAKTVRL